MASTEVIEIKELEQTINQELVAQNVTEAVIANLKEKYGSLKLISLDDKESYLEIKEARQDCKKIRVLAEKICKKGREKAIAEQKAWIAKEKDITGRIGEVEDALEKEEKAFEAEKDRVAALKKKRQEEAFILRQAELTRLGAVYMDGHFVLEDVSYDATLLREADDEVYQPMLEKYKAIFDRHEVARLEKEEKDRIAQKQAEQELAELQELRRQKEEFEAHQREQAERQQREENERKLSLFGHRLDQLKGYTYNGITVSFEGTSFGSMEDILKIPQAEFEAKIADHNKMLAAREEQKIAFEKANAERKAQQEKRIAQMYALGLKFDFNGGYWINYDVFIHTLDIQNYDDAKWDEMIIKTEAHITAFKERELQENNRKAKEQQDAAIALAMQELEEKRKALEIEQQEIERKKAEELEASSDKTKYELLLSYLDAAPWNTFKSPQYKGKSKAIKNAIETAK